LEPPLPDDVPFPPSVLLLDNVVSLASAAREVLIPTVTFALACIENPPYEHATKLLPLAPSSAESELIYDKYKEILTSNDTC
jgi:hypothetical protein